MKVPNKIFFSFVVCLTTIGAVDASTLIDKANRIFIKKEYIKALNLYQRVLTGQKNKNEYPLALFQIAECNRLLGNYEKAQKSFWKLVAQFPQSDLADNAYLSMADWSARKGKEHLPEAVIMYETIISRYRETESVPYAWLGLAKTRYRLNFYEGAENALNHLIKRFPDHSILSEAYYELGTILLNPHNPRRDIKTAIYYLKKLVERYPFSSHLVNAYFDLGSLFWEIGKYQDAIRCYNQITTRYARSFLAPLAQTNIALCYTDAKDYENAIEAYKILLKNYVHPPSVRDNIKMLIDYLKDRQNNKMKISAWKVIQDKAKKSIIYKGDVRITMNQMKIWAHEAIVYPKKKQFIAKGDVRFLWKRNICISSRKLTCNLNTKTCTMTGDVSMNQRLDQGNIIVESWNAIEFSLIDGSFLGRTSVEKIK